MITKEIFDAVEGFRSLVARKAELDQQYFQQFILPAWNAFVVVHQDYMNSIKEYANLVSKEDCDIHWLIEKIAHDSVYTEDLRSNLLSIVASLPRKQVSARRALFNRFLDSIAEYFGQRHGLSTTYTPKSFFGLVGDSVELTYFDEEYQIKIPSGHSFSLSQSAGRIPLAVYLSRKNDLTNRRQAVKFFITISRDLQTKYKRVSIAYNKLRTDILT